MPGDCRSASCFVVVVISSLMALLMGASLQAAADVNRDGRIDVRDVQRTVIQIGNFVLPDFPGQGDVNGSGTVDAVDVQWIVNAIVGVSSQPLSIATASHVPVLETGSHNEVRFAVVGQVGQVGWSYTGQLPPGMSFSADGLLSGTPTLVGQYPIGLTVVDSAAATDSRGFTLIVKEPNLLPVASPDSFLAITGQPLVVPAPGVLANDSDPQGDALGAFLLSFASNGTVSMALDGGFTYLPNPGGHTSDSFIYILTDFRGGVSYGTVTITIGTPPPLIRSDAYSTAVGAPLAVGAQNGLLANDTAPAGQTLVVALAGSPRHGTTTVQPDGAFVYTPVADFEGVDSFIVTVTDQTPTTTHSTVFVRVGSQIQVGEALPVYAGAGPGPVKAGSQIRLTAMIEDLQAASAGSVTGATISGSGLSSSAVLQRGTPVSDSMAEFFVHVTLPAAASTGVHEMQLLVSSASGATKKLRFPLVVYSGSEVEVGPNRQYQTISAGIHFAQPGDAVLIDPGTYSGSSNRMMTLGKNIVVAGREGPHVTVIDAGFAGQAFSSVGPSRSAVVMNLCMINGSTGVLRSSDSHSVVHCIFRNNYSFEHGGAVSYPFLADVLLHNCDFMHNMSGDINSMGDHSGGAIAFNNGARGDLINCVIRNNDSANWGFAYGGAMFVRATPMTQPVVLLDCMLAANKVHGGAVSVGGGICCSEDGRVDVLNCLMRANYGHGGGRTPVMGAACYGVGGAIAADSNSVVRVASTWFDSNISDGNSGGQGGAICVRLGSSLSVTDCRFTENRCQYFANGTFGNSANEGGAINVRNRASANIRHSSFDGDFVADILNSRGGAVAVHQQAHAHFFDCTFNGHSAMSRGGAFFIDSTASVVMDQCSVSNCTGGSLSANSQATGGNGGGAFFLGNNASLLVENSRFQGNTGIGNVPVQGGTYNGGGGVLMYGNIFQPSASAPIPLSVTFRNCLFLSNHGAPFGGVMCKQQDGSTGRRVVNFEFINCTADLNTSVGGGGFGCMQGTDHNIAITATIIWDNVPNSVMVVNQAQRLNMSYSLAGPVSATLQFFSGVNNNIAGPPVFVAGPQGGHYLGATCPCIDSGPTTGTLSQAVLAVTTTSVTGAVDAGPVDLGFHHFVTNYAVMPLATAQSEALFGGYFTAQIPQLPPPLIGFVAVP